MKKKTVSFLFALLTAAAVPPAAFAEVLTLERVVEIASGGAPEVSIAGTRVAEEEARLAGAQVRSVENPKLDVGAGPRTGGGTKVDLEVGVEVPLEFGRRDHRIAVARAAVAREKHAVDDVRRQSVAAAVSAFYRVLQGEERMRIAQERKGVADALLRAATERHQAGDVPRFEVNLAQSEAARAAGDVSAALARLAVERAALAQALGLPSADIQVKGDIRDRALFDAVRAEASADERADLRAAQADLDAAGAAVALARAEQRPEWGVRAAYRREGNENVATAGISMTLPFVNPKSAAVQEASARRERAVLAAENRKTAIAAEIQGARVAYDEATAAVRRLETEALPLQRENESLAEESYRAGKINLSTLLQLRRDAVETRKEYLERLQEAAEAGVALAAAVGKFAVSR